MGINQSIKQRSNSLSLIILVNPVCLTFVPKATQEAQYIKQLVMFHHITKQLCTDLQLILLGLTATSH
jgi:hypothetical protein